MKSLSYHDPVLTNFVAHEDLGKAIYEMNQQYAKAKAKRLSLLNARQNKHDKRMKKTGSPKFRTDEKDHV